MQEAGKLSLEQMEAFLAGSEPVQFEARDQASLYEWVTGTLREQGYSRLGRVGKGLVRRYIAKMTGRSRAQVTRLIGQFTEQGDVKVKERGATGFGLATAGGHRAAGRWWMKPMRR